MKIVIYGGAFNPPHVGHAAVIKMVLEKFPCDEIWVIPSADRRDKKVGTDGEHRLRMVELMVNSLHPPYAKGEKRGLILVSDLEINRPRPTATYETKAELEKSYPEYEFWFLVGSDSLADVERIWVNGMKFYQEANFLVVGRPGYKLPEKLPPSYVFLGDFDSATDVSSTMIRTKLKNGEPVGDYISGAILEYIRENHLYK